MNGQRGHRSGSAGVAALLSLIVPGLGHAWLGAARRGLLIVAPVVIGLAALLGYIAGGDRKELVDTFLKPGVILALLIANKQVPVDSGVPLWVVLGAHTAIGLGTLFGGWRIVHTMGSKITKLTPVGGMSAELAAASTLFFTAHAGIPVSTTHTITGAIVGVGTTQRLSAVRWGVAGRVVWAWVLTIPGSFIVSYFAFLPFKGMG